MKRLLGIVLLLAAVYAAWFWLKGEGRPVQVQTLQENENDRSEGMGANPPRGPANARKENLDESDPHPKRLILVHDDTDAVVAELGRAGGKFKRKMLSVKGVVAELPPNKVKDLRKNLPGLEAFEDLEMSAIPKDVRLDGKGKKPPKGGGGAGTTQPAQTIPWGITAIQATQANAVAAGRGVKVCIVDTGIEGNHPDLQANIAGGRNFVVIGSGVDPNAWTDDNGHGTHVAGTIAALNNSIGVVGVAPMASLYAVKALNNMGTGYLSDVSDGVDECMRAGAQVINMSLNATGDPKIDYPLKLAVERAADAGVFIVVSAGNAGVDISTQIPAGYPDVIAVAAIDANRTFPVWSNTGLSLKDDSAPGVDVRSTWLGANYGTLSGTSMAAPHVAGAVALQISSQQAKLLADDLGQPATTQGSGLVNALRTVKGL
jgi:subtilisin